MKEIIPRKAYTALHSKSPLSVKAASLMVSSDTEGEPLPLLDAGLRITANLQIRSN